MMPTSARARGAEAFISEGLQLAFFSFSFVLQLISLVHRVLHAEASDPALQIRVPSEKWLCRHLSLVSCNNFNPIYLFTIAFQPLLLTFSSSFRD